MAALAWLRWQWSLWWSPVPLLHNVNVVVSLLAWTLLIAMFVSSLLLLIRKDASVAFMGIAWILIPLILLAVGVQYQTLARFSNAGLPEQMLWGVPLLWAMGMLCFAPLAFLAHYALLLFKELNVKR